MEGRKIYKHTTDYNVLTYFNPPREKEREESLFPPTPFPHFLCCLNKHDILGGEGRGGLCVFVCTLQQEKKLAAFQPFKLVSFYRLGVWVGWEGWGWGGVKKALLFAAITGFRGFFFSYYYCIT